VWFLPACIAAGAIGLSAPLGFRGTRFGWSRVRNESGIWWHRRGSGCLPGSV